jgi:hypothetical protein
MLNFENESSIVRTGTGLGIRIRTGTGNEPQTRTKTSFTMLPVHVLVHPKANGATRI